MMRSVIVVIVAIFLSACAQIEKSRVERDNLLPTGRSLWQLTIGKQEKPKFTGLLALRGSEQGLEAVLLDSTGIKLLAERITPDGRIEIQSAIPVIKEKGLPSFLGKGLHRIFLSGADVGPVPCRQDSLIRRCFGESRNGRLGKSASFGPFELWSVEYLINKDNDLSPVSGAILDSGWFVPSIGLERRVVGK